MYTVNRGHLYNLERSVINLNVNIILGHLKKLVVKLLLFFATIF